MTMRLPEKSLLEWGNMEPANSFSSTFSLQWAPWALYLSTELKEYSETTIFTQSQYCFISSSVYGFCFLGALRIVKEN